MKNALYLKCKHEPPWMYSIQILVLFVFAGVHDEFSDMLQAKPV